MEYPKEEWLELRRRALEKDFSRMNQRQQEVIGDMEVSGERTEQPEKTAAKSLLPPPVMSFKSFPYT